MKLKKLALAASLIVPALFSSAAHAGVEELAVDRDGLPYYGKGSTSGKYGWVGIGRGRVYCKGDFFADDDDSERTAGIRVPKTQAYGWKINTLKYSAEAGSASCARNKTILICTFENPLEYCKANVVVH
jgi:hypothetical protein